MQQPSTEYSQPQHKLHAQPRCYGTFMLHLELSVTCTCCLQEEGFSPARAGPAYAPALTSALPSRQPSPLGLTNPNSKANMFGDLFAPPGGSLPNVAVPNCPELPVWNHQRPYLTGQFLMEGLEVEDETSGRQQALESFSSAVQEVVGTVRTTIAVFACETATLQHAGQLLHAYILYKTFILYCDTQSNGIL